MIHFEEDSSPFFIENKKFANHLEHILKDFKIEGECNSFGFDLVATKNDNQKLLVLKFLKKTPSRNSIYFQGDGTDNISTEILVEHIYRPGEITISDNPLKRILLSSDLKKEIPSPFFIDSKDLPKEKLMQIIHIFKDEKLYFLNFENKKLTIKINRALENPIEMIEKIEQIL